MKLEVRYPSVLGTAIVAGTFSVIVCLLLAVNFAGRGQYELFDTPKFQELRAQLRENPNDPQRTKSIRQLDLQLRTDYFRRRQFMARGIYLLLGGVAVTLVTARWASALRPKLPDPSEPDSQQDPSQQQLRWGRWGVAGLVAGLLLLLSGYALQANRILPVSLVAGGSLPADEAPGQTMAAAAAGASSEHTNSQPLDDTKPTADETGAVVENPEQGPATSPQPVAAPLPSQATYLTQWPRFRGPTGSGVCTFADIPTKWDVVKGDGVLWQAAVPLPGYNSPVVWQDRVFLSGATADEQAVFCFDANQGTLLWRLDVPLELSGAEELEVMDSTGYAAPTVATDGLRVYAIFASGNLVAADWEGKQLWRKNLGIPKNPYGHASSLATYNDLVIVQFDQGTAEDDKSKLFAFRGATGEVAWEVARKVPSSWATPIIVDQKGRTMVITCVAPWVIAYAAADGSELWRAKCLGGEVGPSPAFADGVVYAANESGGMYAISTDGSGDVTDSHIQWMTDIDVPDVCSPLASDKQLFLLSHGLLGCFDRAAGDGEGSADEVAGTALGRRSGRGGFIVPESGGKSDLSVFRRGQSFHSQARRRQV